MLIHFRSARTLKVPVFISLLVLAWLLGPGATASSARMEDPVPYPHLDIWPEPQDDHVADVQSTTLVSQQSRSIESHRSERRQDLESDVSNESSAVSRVHWLVYLLNWIYLVP